MSPRLSYTDSCTEISYAAYNILPVNNYQLTKTFQQHKPSATVPTFSVTSILVLQNILHQLYTIKHFASVQNKLSQLLNQCTPTILVKFRNRQVDANEQPIIDEPKTDLTQIVLR